MLDCRWPCFLMAASRWPRRFSMVFLDDRFLMAALRWPLSMAIARWPLLNGCCSWCPMANARWPMTLLFDGCFSMAVPLLDGRAASQWSFSMAAPLLNGLFRWPLLNSRSLIASAQWSRWPRFSMVSHWWPRALCVCCALRVRCALYRHFAFMHPCGPLCSSWLLRYLFTLALYVLISSRFSEWWILTSIWVELDAFGTSRLAAFLSYHQLAFQNCWPTQWWALLHQSAL